MCEKAASEGICETNSEAMLTECPVSCKVCGDGKCQLLYYLVDN